LRSILAVQVVVRILGFPEAARQAVGVEDRAVGPYAVTAGLGAALGHEAPAVEAGGIGEQVLERRRRPSSFSTPCPRRAASERWYSRISGWAGEIWADGRGM